MADISSLFPGGFTAALTGTDIADPIDAFLRHCEANGLIINSGVRADGEIHRVPHTSSKRSAADGWYILHLDGKIPAGMCGSWKEPSFESSWRAELGRPLTFVESTEHKRWMDEVKRKKEAERKANQEAAADRAEEEVGTYTDASADHPYLLRKKVQPHGIKIDRAGRLVVPITTCDGEIISYQTIDGEGQKRFLKGGKIDGGSYEIRGNRKMIFITEGFATGASIHEATGYTVFVAFNCGNLGKVAKSVRETFPGSKIVVGADNDQFTDGNPGRTEGDQAAKAVHGEMVYPIFSEAEIAAGQPTDFNDLHVLRGIDAVAEQIERVAGPVIDKLAFEFSRIDTLTLSEISWIVDDYIESDSLAQIFGDPGGGKSFVAIDVACCVATGTPWHGHEVKQGAVFYVAGEGHNGLVRRFRGWSLGNGISLDGMPLYKSHRAVQLYDATEAAIVAESIQRLSQEAGVMPSMIVIDTLARNMGGDENSTEDMNSFIQHLDLYLRQPYHCCVLVIHHSGAMDKDRSRGSTALRGALDAEYKCALDSGSKTIMFESKKMKDAEMPAPMSFAITQVDLPMVDKHGDAVKGAYLTSVDLSAFNASITKKTIVKGYQKKCMDALVAIQSMRETAGQDAAIEDDVWRESCRSHGVPAKRVTESWDGLMEKGLVYLDPDGCYSIIKNSK